MTEMQRITEIIQSGAPMTLEQIIRQLIDKWRGSDALRWMQVGERYYRGDADIRQRKRTMVDESGRKVTDPHLANNQMVHLFARKLADQKVGYLLGKPLSIQTENESYRKALGEYFDKAMLRVLKNIAKDAVNKGIAWLHVYYDEEGVFRLKRMRPEEIVPVWADDAHTELEAVIRRYEVETYEGTVKRITVKVEWWDTKGVRRYVHGPAGLTLDTDAGEVTTHFLAGEQPLNWERVPFIPFKYNDEEQPLIQLIKSLIDGYDARSSDDANNLEDLPNSIYVLKNYDGTNLGEFRKNLSLYRAVKVSQDGGVETLSLDMNVEALKRHLDQLRKDIYEFGRGVDTQSDKFGNSPSGIALRFLYSDLDLDANIMETEFQASLEQLLWFVDVHLANTDAGDFSDEPVDFIFNRDIMINETEAVTNVKSSVGILSEETLVAQHPWVTDVEGELDRLAEQRKQVDEYGGLPPDKSTGDNE
jgi:SPP1 family phage portal protein